MPRGKKELAEQIIPKLREVEVELAASKPATLVDVSPRGMECPPLVLTPPDYRSGSGAV